MNPQQKREIVDLIHKLDKPQLLNFFKFIVDHNIHYTQNNNGVFVNLNQTPQTNVHLLYNFLKK